MNIRLNYLPTNVLSRGWTFVRSSRCRALGSRLQNRRRDAILATVSQRRGKNNKFLLTYPNTLQSPLILFFYRRAFHNFLSSFGVLEVSRSMRI